MYKLTHQQFVERAVAVHGDQYEYPEKLVGWTVKLPIRHKKCGKISSQKPNDHLGGHGCFYCTRAYKPTHEEFLERARAIYGDNQYQYLNEYEGSLTKILIRHTCGYEFWKMPYNHVNKRQGCPKCRKRPEGSYTAGFFKRHPEKLNHPAWFYCLEFRNDTEHFYKIGITIDVKLRLHHHIHRNPKYLVKVLNVQSMPLFEAWQKEDKMKKFLKNSKMSHYPASKLNSKGSTECFTTKSVGRVSL